MSGSRAEIASRPLTISSCVNPRPRLPKSTPVRSSPAPERNTMPRLIVTTREGDTREVEAQAGLSVMEAIRDNGFDELLALCGGCCSCATCHVQLDEAWFAKVGPRKPDEDDLLDT